MYTFRRIHRVREVHKRVWLYKRFKEVAVGGQLSKLPVNLGAAALRHRIDE
jgi:hypothetical protein